MQRCAICQKDTDKCCSLCNRVFYCSPEHQQVHWHMNHKFNCEGKHRSMESDHEQFKIYASSQLRSAYQTRSFQQEAKVFIEVFESRLGARTDVINRYNAAKENGTPPILQKDLVREANELVKLSKKVSESYKVGLGDHLDEVYGLITNSFIVKIDQILDRVLQARCYQLACMSRQLKQNLLLISSEVDPYPDAFGDEFKRTYQHLLSAVIDISQSVGLDKISEKMFGFYIKTVEKFEGVWEQIYAYFNMGTWYANKTYYQKAIKCYNYAAQMASKHNINEGAGLLIADATFNIALCRYSLRQVTKAADQMQEAYRLRCQCMGKSSLEASEALLVLSKWLLKEKKYESCLQFVMECLRIRRSNSSFQKDLQEVNQLIYQIYQTIKEEKQQSEKVGTPASTKYFQKLLQSQKAYKEDEPDNRQSFTKRFLEEEKEMVVFKLVITPELAQTLSSQQWSKIGELIDLNDKKMEKEEAIRIIFQSEFSQSLNEEQRTEFVKLNKVS